MTNQSCGGSQNNVWGVARFKCTRHSGDVKSIIFMILWFSQMDFLYITTTDGDETRLYISVTSYTQKRHLYHQADYGRLCILYNLKLFIYYCIPTIFICSIDRSFVIISTCTSCYQYGLGFKTFWLHSSDFLKMPRAKSWAVHSSSGNCYSWMQNPRHTENFHITFFICINNRFW
jgi:hypothetical protein